MGAAVADHLAGGAPRRGIRNLLWAWARAAGVEAKRLNGLRGARLNKDPGPQPGCRVCSF